jgi:hypothetical protein
LNDAGKAGSGVHVTRGLAGAPDGDHDDDDEVDADTEDDDEVDEVTLDDDMDQLDRATGSAVPSTRGPALGLPG